MRKKYIIPVIISLCAAQLFLCSNAGAQYNITTVAGTGTAGSAGDGGPATTAELNLPSSVTTDALGNIYIGDAANNKVRIINNSGTISTFAGTGTAGYNGDGIPASTAELNNAVGVTIDNAGNLLIADEYSQRIRRVNTINKNISTFAGNGKLSFSGDGGPATNAQMFFPLGVAKDASGNIYIADCWNQRIRKITPSGTISTYAGIGKAGFSGDGGLATAAELNYPNGIAIDASGNLYIADNNNNRIRKISASGTITTFAGNGWPFYLGDGGQATAATLNNPSDVAIDPATGFVYIADKNNNAIRMVNNSGVITTVAGNGTAGFYGDGGMATSAELNHPYGVAIDSYSDLFITDNNNNRVREVVGTGSISTIAGNGTAGYNGDGVAATAELNNPVGIWVDGSGKIYIGDAGNNRIRQVSGTNIYTVAGNGTGGYAGDGGPATAAKINTPAGVTVDGSGNIYFADELNQRVRMVNGSGIISLVAGTGVISYSGDNGPADSAQIFFPTATAVDNNGNTYIADCFNHRVRKVDVSGTITTFAGTGNWGYNGDGGPAANAELFFPTGVAADAMGNVYIADGTNNRIRKVNTSGTITTFAGTGASGYNGDGGAATAAELNDPTGVAVDLFGDVLIADKNNNRIRKVDPVSGKISTIAGDGSQGFAGDGGAATNAELYNPWSITADYSGNIYVADYNNNRIRKLTPNCTFTVTVSNIKNVTCIGAGDGSASATASGGTAPYTYSWSPSGGNNSNASGMTAGTYTVTVNDAAGCTGSATVSINRPPYTINTYAGNYTSGSGGDGGPATSAELYLPWQIGLDKSGNLFVADKANNKIRKITPSGIISTFAGTGALGFKGDGGQATAAELNQPVSVCVDAANNVYIADQGSNCIRKVDASGIITTIVNSDTIGGFSGDGGAATAAQISLPGDIIVDSKGNLYIVDSGNQLIRKVTKGGIITTIAGKNGLAGYSGDGGQATAAKFNYPAGIGMDNAGNVYIADYQNNAIRRIDTTTGIITTFAGTGTGGFSGDGGPATAAKLRLPWKIIFDPANNAYISDNANNRIRMVNPAGIITTIAGNGTDATPPAGDGGLAVKAQIGPLGLAIDASYNIYVSESFSDIIRKLYACPYCSLAATATVLNNTSCGGNSDGSAQAVASAGIGMYTYTWSPIGGTGAIATGLSAGSYTVTINDSIGCTSTASVSITAPGTNASVSGPDSICLGDVVTLTASGGTSYHWNNGDTTATITEHPVADTVYVVTIYSGPCFDTIIHPVYVGTDGSICKLHVYSGLTPNGDGFNDYWQIDNIELFPDNSVEIYNRWGTLVWNTHGYNNNTVVWRGLDNNGKPLPDGTYFYVVKTDNRTDKGWVQLTR